MCLDEYFIKWVLTLVKLHREFFRTAWFARRRYEYFLYQQLQIINNNPMYILIPFLEKFQVHKKLDFLLFEYLLNLP